MLEQFLKMNKTTVRIEYERKAATICTQLRKIARSDPRYAGISVRQSEAKVYPVREGR